MALRVIVVGTGSRGQDWMRELQSAPAYQLVGVVDSNQEVLKRALSNGFSAAVPCFTDFQTALEQVNCDAVIVATSVDSHVAPCELALSRGLPVLVEKPFALTLDEAKRLVSLAEQQATPLIVAQNYRYMRAFRTARRVIAEGQLGRIGMVVCQYYRVPHAMAASLARVENSGLWGAGVHHLDALRYILDKPVTKVLSHKFSMPWGTLPRGASMSAMLSFGDETSAFYSLTYESSGHQFFERGQEFYLRFVGEKATLHVFQRWLILCANGKLPRVIRRGKRIVTEERVLLDQLEGAILHNVKPDSSGRDNLQTMAIVEACLMSADREVWVDPQELLDDEL